MYRIRLQYTKSKEATWISHLDLMRVFERALKRANINVKHSEGFNPRPELVFAHPLSVGIESDCELCEILLNEFYEEAVIVKMLNSTLPSGIAVLSAKYVDLKVKSLMSQVFCANYEITFEIPESCRKNATPKEIVKLNAEIKTNFDKFYNQEKILVTKKGKKGDSIIDIKPLILKKEFLGDSKYDFKVRAGSEKNLKPELIVKAFEEYIGGEIPYNIKRTKITLA